MQLRLSPARVYRDVQVFFAHPFVFSFFLFIFANGVERKPLWQKERNKLTLRMKNRESLVPRFCYI